MSARADYLVVEDLEDFYIGHAGAMRRNFSEHAIDSRETPDAHVLMRVNSAAVAALDFVEPDLTTVGMAKVKYTSYGTYLEFIEVARKVRGRRFGPRLMARVFSLAAERGGDLVISPYTPMGRDALLPYEDRLRRRYEGRLTVVNEPRA